MPEVRVAHRSAGAERPSAGYLDNTLTQPDFVHTIGLPGGTLDEARAGLLEGAWRVTSRAR